MSVAEVIREEPGCDDVAPAERLEEYYRGSAEEDDKAILSDLRTLDGISLAALRLISIPEPKWMVDGYLEEGSLSILFGPPNVGKTIFATWLIMQALKAGYRVKFIEAEGGAHALRKRLLRAADAELSAGHRFNEGALNVVWGVYLNLADPEHQGNLERAVDGYDLCVLDSMHAMSGGIDENSNEWGEISNGLAWVRTNSGCAVSGLHHSVKTVWAPGEQPTLASLRGHGALAGRADVALAVAPVAPGDEREDCASFSLWDLKQREQAKSKPKLCRCTMTGPHANMEIEDIEPVSKAATVKVDLRLLEQVEAVIPYDGGVTKQWLENVITGRAASIRAAVDQLEHSGRIIKASRFQYIRTAGSNPVTSGRPVVVPLSSGTGDPDQSSGRPPPLGGRLTAGRPGDEAKTDESAGTSSSDGKDEDKAGDPWRDAYGWKK